MACLTFLVVQLTMQYGTLRYVTVPASGGDTGRPATALPATGTRVRARRRTAGRPGVKGPGSSRAALTRPGHLARSVPQSAAAVAAVMQETGQTGDTSPLRYSRRCPDGAPFPHGSGLPRTTAAGRAPGWACGLSWGCLLRCRRPILCDVMGQAALLWAVPHLKRGIAPLVCRQGQRDALHRQPAPAARVRWQAGQEGQGLLGGGEARRHGRAPSGRLASWPGLLP